MSKWKRWIQNRCNFGATWGTDDESVTFSVSPSTVFQSHEVAVSIKGTIKAQIEMVLDPHGKFVPEMTSHPVKYPGTVRG